MTANQMERKSNYSYHQCHPSDGCRREIRYVCFGCFYRDKGNRYLHYEEKQLAGTIRTVLKIADNELLLMRSGAVNMRMHFFEIIGEVLRLLIRGQENYN